jgi:hypothetical protein
MNNENFAYREERPDVGYLAKIPYTKEISKQNIQLNDNFTETYNPIYNTIISTN